LKQAAGKVASGKDIVIMEGPPEAEASKETLDTVRELGAGVIAVVPYADRTSAAGIEKAFGSSFLGIVYNKVPLSRLELVNEEASGAKIKVLGVLPENRALLTFNVREMAALTQGELLNGGEDPYELVENFMLGAMVVNSGLDYFGRKGRKAALVRSDRPDMQLAALETDTACLVLTGSEEPPLYNVMEKAQKREIPVIQCKEGAESVIGAIDGALSGVRFGQDKKIDVISGLLKQHVELGTLDKALGIAG
jgi:BioD-like phosphotransacetylase family protein